MTISALLLLFRARTWAVAVIIFLAVTSRAVLFAVERGNTDQVIFFLLVFGFFFIERLRVEVRSFLKGALIVCLSLLKIFPIAAVIALVRNRRGVWTALVTAVLSAIAIVVTAGRELSQIRTNTPQSFFASFGSLPFFVMICNHLSHPLSAMIQRQENIASLGALLLAVLSILAAVSYRKQLNRLLPPLDFNQATGCIAGAGLAIYCFAFLRGSSYDYRLIFLLGAIAYLIEDINQRKSLRSLPAAITLLVLLWKPSHPSFIFEMFDGLVFASGCAWLGTSLLDNLRTPSSSVDPPSIAI
jgi:hypothetical protein